MAAHSIPLPPPSSSSRKPVTNNQRQIHNNNYNSRDSSTTTTRLLLLASMVLFTLGHSTVLVRATPAAMPIYAQQPSPDTTFKEDVPTVVGQSVGNGQLIAFAADAKRASALDRFSPIGPSYNAYLYSYPQLYSDYIAEILRPRKRGYYDDVYEEDPFVIKKEMPGVLRFGKRHSSELQQLVNEKKAVPGVLRFGKRSDIPGVLRFGKREGGFDSASVPGVLRFGKREGVPGVLRFGKRDMPGVLRFGKRRPSSGGDIPGVLRFGK